MRLRGSARCVTPSHRSRHAHTSTTPSNNYYTHTYTARDDWNGMECCAAVVRSTFEYTSRHIDAPLEDESNREPSPWKHISMTVSNIFCLCLVFSYIGRGFLYFACSVDKRFGCFIVCFIVCLYRWVYKVWMLHCLLLLWLPYSFGCRWRLCGLSVFARLTYCVFRLGIVGWRPGDDLRWPSRDS